jgi:hypothetical protein
MIGDEQVGQWEVMPVRVHRAQGQSRRSPHFGGVACIRDTARTEEKLDLFELAAGLMAETCAGPAKIMWCDSRKPTVCGRLGRDPASPDSPDLVD